MYIYARILEISKRRYRIFNRIFHFAACTRLQLAATGSNRVNNKVERENKIMRGEMISKNNPRKSFFFFLNDLSLSFFHEIYGNHNIGVNPPSFGRFSPFEVTIILQVENEQSLSYQFALGKAKTSTQS